MELEGSGSDKSTSFLVLGLEMSPPPELLEEIQSQGGGEWARTPNKGSWGGGG